MRGGHNPLTDQPTLFLAGFLIFPQISMVRRLKTICDEEHDP